MISVKHGEFKLPYELLNNLRLHCRPTGWLEVRMRNISLKISQFLRVVTFLDFIN